MVVASCKLDYIHDIGCWRKLHKFITDTCLGQWLLQILPLASGSILSSLLVTGSVLSPNFWREVVLEQVTADLPQLLLVGLIPVTSRDEDERGEIAVSCTLRFEDITCTFSITHIAAAEVRAGWQSL